MIRTTEVVPRIGPQPICDLCHSATASVVFEAARGRIALCEDCQAALVSALRHLVHVAIRGDEPADSRTPPPQGTSRIVGASNG